MSLTELIVELFLLQDELERQHERMRELQLETAKRIAEERSSADRRYTYQVRLSIAHRELFNVKIASLIRLISLVVT